MDRTIEWKAELVTQNRSWIVGILNLSSDGLEFHCKNNQFNYSFQKLNLLKIEIVYAKRHKILSRSQECVRVSSTEGECIFHVLSSESTESIIQMIYEYASLQSTSTDAIDLPPEAETLSTKEDNTDTDSNAKRTFLSVEELKPDQSPEAPVRDTIDDVQKEQASESSDEDYPDESEMENVGQREQFCESDAKKEEDIARIEDKEDNECLAETTFGDVADEDSNKLEFDDLVVNSDLLQEAETEKAVTETEPAPLTYKRKFFGECESFSAACVEHVPEKRESNHPEKNQRYVFDIMNVGYMHTVDNYQFHSMPTYFASNGKLIKCRPDGIYQTDLFTAYTPFLPHPSVYQNEIISRSIEDSVSSGEVPADNMQMLCLMPDIVDDFSHVFRNQLELKGVRLFQIPRSIALAYAVQPIDSANISTYPDEFLCLDYDGEELIAIKIRRELDDHGEPVFIRMGRFPLSEDHLSYRSLANEYIKQYTEKYSVPLTKRMRRILIETKLLQNLLLSSENRPLILADGDAIVDLWRDDDILADLHASVREDAQNICNQYGITSYALCCFGWSYAEQFSGEDILATGCHAIRRRAEMHKTLWEEYLPSLQLDVNQDGAFASLQLISEKDRRQQIESAYIGKTVEIVVENGRIVLGANKDHYDLPLEREVYGNMNKEKLARFQPEKPLENDTEVELKIFYSYGDVDSYKLVAISQDGKTIESQWCDAEILRNDPPKYTPVPFPPMSDIDNLEVVKGFTEFISFVQGPTEPFDDMLYSYKRDPERPYSKYLRSLNARGFPFRRVRLYFDIDNQTSIVKEQIKRMFDGGVFDCIAETLLGYLPAHHDLGKGTSISFPNTDQANVLRDNLEKICREFGFLYTYQEDSVERLIDALRTIKPANKKTAIQTWAPITAYITRDNDRFDLWETFAKALETLQPDKPLRTVDDLRTISNVCFLTQNWIFEFYHSSHGRKDVDWLLKNIRAVLYGEEWNQGKAYNARKIRDVLELLLCICMLKKEDSTILDCNAPETKQLVKQLKKIDSDMRKLDDRGMLKHPFDCRIQGYSIPSEYRKVNPIIYCLVQTLTGGESISLVGFTDNSFA